ncbi:MAG: hypothetical protein H6828_04420 [Planctomycetes bacterium]|nr:hypothetical protein [Planctomycetota bacterium]
MKHHVLLARTTLGASLFSAALLAGCSGSGSGSGGGGSSTNNNLFSLSTVSVDPGQTWQINRAISFTFSEAVDFDTVNLNTISIQETGGAPAVGDFFLSSTDPRTVIFQPVCPRTTDFSDAGFRPGGVSYQVNVPDRDSGATTVMSLSGRLLVGGSTRTFQTPNTVQLDELFLDTATGPPTPLLRPVNTDGSYVEVGGDPNNREYFETGLAGTGALPGGYRVPINLYSDQSTKIAVVLRLNQAVSPTDDNISSTRIQLQYRTSGGSWVPVSADLTLTENCTATGSTVRIDPIGVLPQGRELRVVISPQFEDIVGDRNIVPLDNFANMDTDFATTDGVNPATTADEYLETFLDTVNEDREAALDAPRATWGPNGLSASFAFDGTGGPGGEFDLVLTPGTFVFDTNSTLVFGGPGGVPQFSQLAINGRLDVHDLIIPVGATMRIQGPNPALILASGKVVVEGTLSADGSAADQVFTLNTPNQPEPGASGQAGGGAGGTASYLTSQYTPKGENGYGAFGIANGGGVGGDGGWSNSGTDTNRRAAGGGGGAFGHDQLANVSTADCVDQRIWGLDAEPGFPGSPASFSCVNVTVSPAQGGMNGPVPFGDLGGVGDDFYGTKRAKFGTPDETLVTGELLEPHAGAGGGAGGDAAYVPSGTFPPATLVPVNTDKGCGGGGGAGSLTILALGDIQVGAAGKITAIGGHGSGGENTGGTNRIGGGSGGGSGGHIILQTAGKLDLSACPAPFGPTTGTQIADLSIDARGGEGGAGADNNGGADENEENLVKKDAKHDGSANDNSYIPPLDAACVTYVNSISGTGTQTWIVRGAGGDGGPGLIQIHVGNLSGAVGTHDVRYPGTGIVSELGKAVRPYPHGYNGISGAWVDQLLPIFGRISKAQSNWIPLGGVAVAPDTSVTDPLAFLFDGTNTTTGLVESTGGVVSPLPAILAPGAAVEAAGLPEITGPRTLRFDASALADDIYKLNPSLLRRFTLKVGVASSTVASAAYVKEGANEYLDVTVSSTDPEITSQTGLVELRPRYFRLVTQGTVDSLPSNATVKMEFQATIENVQGAPSESDVSTWVTDISDLDTTSGAANPWRFLRYRVTFDIGQGATTLSATTPRPTLEFLRMPVKF